MLLYGLTTPYHKKLRISKDINSGYRVPEYDELIKYNYDNVHVCDIVHTLYYFNNNISELYLDVNSNNIQWYEISWNCSQIKSTEDKILLKELIDRGLIRVPIQKNDTIEVWIKKTIFYSKYKFYEDTNSHEKTYQPWVYYLPYWVILDMIEHEKMFGRNPTSTISIVFNYSIAINTVMNNL